MSRNSTDNVAAIVFARLSSSRLPGKVLHRLGFSTMLDLVLDRLESCDVVDDVVVATSAEVSDDGLESYCQRRGVKVFRGSLENVACRAVEASTTVGASQFFRVNADSPFVAVDLFDRALTTYFRTDADLVSNVHPRVLPPGASVELVRTQALAAALPSLSADEAEHVTTHFYRNSDHFKIAQFDCSEITASSDTRLVVDDARDMALATDVLGRMDRPPHTYSTREVIELVELVVGR